MDNLNLWLLLGLAVAVLLIMRSLRWRDKDEENPLKLEDLLLGEDGRISKAACVMFGAFLLTSWVILHQTLNKTLTEVTFAAYIAAWIAPTVAKLIAGKTQ